MTSPTSAKRRGFTLIEMLCVIGIIAVLISILLPVVNRAQRAGQRARVAAQLQTISVALESYKTDHKDYPRFGVARGANGSDILVRALIAPFDAPVDGADKGGFRLRLAQGTKYGPYIPEDKFPFTWKPGQPDEPCELQDGNGGAILYYPATTTRPNLSAGTGFIGAHPASLFDASYGSNRLSAEAFAFMMGDDSSSSPNGRIDNGEVPRSTGPFVLWATGPDQVFGPKQLTRNEADRSDDVTTFR